MLCGMETKVIVILFHLFIPSHFCSLDGEIYLLPYALFFRNWTGLTDGSDPPICGAVGSKCQGIFLFVCTILSLPLHVPLRVCVCLWC